MKISAFITAVLASCFLCIYFTCEPAPPVDGGPTSAPTDEPLADPTATPVTGVNQAGIAPDDDGFLRWADGSFACNCNEYRFPENPGYAYQGETGSGFYKIQPNNAIIPLEVYCDMATDEGGWTLVLLNSGYGNSPSPGWVAAILENNIEGDMSGGILSGFDQLLGLQYWEALGSTLRVEVGSGPETIHHRALYDFYFNEVDRYTINLSNEDIRTTGSPSPGLYQFHNNKPFSTYDSDNDSYSGNCASEFGQSPWWYTACWNGSFWGYGGNDDAFWIYSGSSPFEFDWGAFWIR